MYNKEPLNFENFSLRALRLFRPGESAGGMSGEGIFGMKEFSLTPEEKRILLQVAREEIKKNLMGAGEKTALPAGGEIHAPHGAFVKKFPVAPIITTRGCPFNCSFCASKCMWMQKLRFRNPIRVVDEIELLNKQYGVKEFHFEDDNFTANKNHAMKVCQEIIRRNLDIVWACPNGVRIDTLDEQLLRIMKKSGCYLLAFGIETGSQEIADNMNKHLDLSKVPEKLKMVRDAGIETWGFFIIGLPGDNVKTISKTIDFAVSNAFRRAQFCIFTPLPGSEIFSKMENKDYDWDKFNFFNTAYCTSLQEKEIQELHKKAFRKFYLRPSIIFGLIRNLKLRQVKWLLKRAADYKFLKSKK